MCDDYFLQLAEADICNFFEKISLPSVDILLFPPLLSRYRYSIHKIVEDSFPDLQTVSVGQEDERRTAVHLGRKGVEAVMSAETPSSTPQKSAFQKDSDLKNSNRPDKRNAKPSMQPYIPPPQRNRDGTSSPRPEKNFASMERSLKTGLRKKDAKLGKEGQKKTIPIKSRSSETEVSIVGDDLRKEASDVHIESQGPCQSQLPGTAFAEIALHAYLLK
jgi:R3H domain